MSKEPQFYGLRAYIEGAKAKAEEIRRHNEEVLANPPILTADDIFALDHPTDDSFLPHRLAINVSRMRRTGKVAAHYDADRGGNHPDSMASQAQSGS